MDKDEPTRQPRAVPGSDPDEVLIFEPDLTTRRLTVAEFKDEMSRRDIVLAPSLAK